MAYWIDLHKTTVFDGDTWDIKECSECHGRAKMHGDRKHCPHCRARMSNKNKHGYWEDLGLALAFKEQIGKWEIAGRIRQCSICENQVLMCGEIPLPEECPFCKAIMVEGENKCQREKE